MIKIYMTTYNVTKNGRVSEWGGPYITAESREQAMAIAATLYVEHDNQRCDIQFAGEFGGEVPVDDCSPHVQAWARELGVRAALEDAGLPDGGNRGAA